MYIQRLYNGIKIYKVKNWILKKWGRVPKGFCDLRVARVHFDF